MKFFSFLIVLPMFVGLGFVDLTEEGINFAKDRSKEFTEGKNIQYVRALLKLMISLIIVN